MFGTGLHLLWHRIGYRKNFFAFQRFALLYAAPKHQLLCQTARKTSFNASFGAKEVANYVHPLFRIEPATKGAARFAKKLISAKHHVNLQWLRRPIVLTCAQEDD